MACASSPAACCATEASPAKTEGATLPQLRVVQARISLLTSELVKYAKQEKPSPASGVWDPMASLEKDVAAGAWTRLIKYSEVRLARAPGEVVAQQGMRHTRARTAPGAAESAALCVLYAAPRRA